MKIRVTLNGGADDIDSEVVEGTEGSTEVFDAIRAIVCRWDLLPGDTIRICEEEA